MESTKTRPLSSVCTPTSCKPNPSAQGARPTATRIRSPEISDFCPPDSKDRVVPDLLFFAAVTLVESKKRRPCFSKIFLATFATSGSNCGQISGRNSIIVTSVPSRDQTQPSSSPIAPPPTTTIFLGTFSNAMP